MTSSSDITSSVAVHAIQTGTVRIRANQIHGKGSGKRRLLATYLAREWGGWLPIFAWLIEHPEGPIVVDTGETSRIAEPGYFPGWHPYFRRGVQERVAPEEEIGSQLENRWLPPTDVPHVVLTHLHTDHAGGLHAFPQSEILIERHAFAEASGVAGRLRGFLPNRFPAWLRPTLFELEPHAFGPFARSLPLTRAGDVVIVATPGHTPDHVSVVVRTAGVTFFLAGDTSYTQQLMLDGQVDGVAASDAVARDTLRRIRLFAEQEPLVYLPTHDPESATRLALRQTIFPAAQPA